MIYFIIFGYVLPMLFSAYCCYKLVKYDLKRGIDFKVSQLILTVLFVFLPVVNWLISLVSIFSTEFNYIIFPKGFEVFGFLDKVLVKGDRNA